MLFARFYLRFFAKLRSAKRKPNFNEINEKLKI